jgi:hypothetical protein
MAGMYLVFDTETTGLPKRFRRFLALSHLAPRVFER